MTAPDRLAELQRALTAALRAPEREGAGPAAAGVPELHRQAGVALYRQLSWRRQTDILRREHRLVAALLGADGFAALAAGFLAAHPPRSHGEVCAGLDDFVAAARPALGLEVEALIEAVRVDRAFQRVVTAGPPQPLHLDARAEVQLVASPAVALVDEHWPLVALRRQLVPAADTRAALPRRHPSARTWLLAGKSRGVLALPVVPLQARLLRELALRPVGEAFARLAGDAALAQHGQSWLRRSLALGMWRATTSGAA